LFLASTQPPIDAVSMALERVGPRRMEALSVPLDGIAFTVLPGYLTRFWPWEYWGNTVCFLFVLASVLLTIAAAGLLRRGWIVLLAWGASPALLSFAVAGYPHAAGYFPHALALWVTLDRRIERRLVSTLALSLLACASSWYCYDPARTVFLVFLGAAILRGDARWPARLVWLAVGALQLWTVLAWLGNGGGILPTDFDPARLWSAVVSVGRSVFVARYLDEPVLLVAAFLSFFFFRRDRLPVFGLWLAQLGLVVMLAAKGPELLCPRRFLLVECYCLLVVGRMYAEASRAPRRMAITHDSARVMLLLAGSVWQVAGLVQFARQPRPAVSWALPYAHAQVDFQVVRFGAEWADEMASRVEAGETLIVIYSLGFYAENATNPTKLLERMYLRLGHERFVDSVLVFGATPCLPNCLPLRPLSEIDDVLDRIRPGGPIEPSAVALYYTQDLLTTYQHTAEPESAAVFAAVRRRFSLEQEPTPDARLMRFRVRPRPPDASDGFSIEAASGRYERVHEGVRDERHVDWSGPPFEQYWVVDEPRAAPYLIRRPWADAPFAVRLSARLHVSRAGTFELLLGSDEEAQVTVDDDVTTTKPTDGPPVSRTAHAHP
jgi:hypothetical protein